MNINQEDVTGHAGEANNNVSCGGSVEEATGCVSCSDQSVGSACSSQEIDAGEWQLQREVTADTTCPSSCRDEGNTGQVQLGDSLLYSQRDCGRVAQGESGLGRTSQDLLEAEVTTYLESDQGQVGGGHLPGLVKTDPGIIAGVCLEPGPDNQTEGDTLTMRNCTCDEGSLCYCPSSFFDSRSDVQDVRCQSLKKSSRNMTSWTGPVKNKDLEKDMDARILAEQEITSEKLNDDDAKAAVEETEDVKQCKSFMEDLVDRIFNNSASICQEDSAKFGEYCRLAIGRQWFARLVDSQRVNCKKVTEQTFYRLVQFFAVCLFECNDADDFTPGKSLMNMCFTFYHEHEGVPRCDDTTQKSFLYSHLTDQPIWKSLRFWNAAFFDAVHQERKQRQPDHQVNWRHLTMEERENTEILNENITFGQLVTFLHNMMELELSQQMCQEFLDKMATIGNLSAEQKDLIQSNIGNHFHAEDSNKSRKHQRPFNKLSFMKRKVGREAMV